MWKPDQSLDDWIERSAPEVTSESPRSVSLGRTGEVEVLKPLIAAEDRARPARNAFGAFRPSGALQPLWFRRFLAVGSGALVMIAFVLLTAILVGINDPAAGPYVATSETADDKLTQPAEPFSFDVSSPWNFALANGGVDSVRSSSRRKPVRRSIHLAVSKPTRQVRPILLSQEPKFVPTTLVIYAENGVINTRIEPWLYAGYKKPATLND